MTKSSNPQLTKSSAFRALQPGDFEADSAAARQLFQGADFECWGLARPAAKVDGVYLDEQHYALQLVRSIRETSASFESGSSSGVRRRK
jgi:hypothetical protein